ncbi:hypothetical protein QL285_022016 [Trifolium repens]|nr:hypothetical protein QL285_022016 [Trifolium repens]
MGTSYQRIHGSGLSSVKQVYIDAEMLANYSLPPLILLSWLYNLANIKSLTVSASTIQILSLVPDLFKVKLPSLLCNLKTLKVKLKPLPFGLHLILEPHMFKNKSLKEALKMHNKAGAEAFVTIHEIVHWVEMDLKTMVHYSLYFI